jgi:hypothetical protein
VFESSEEFFCELLGLGSELKANDDDGAERLGCQVTLKSDPNVYK